MSGTCHGPRHGPGQGLEAQLTRLQAALEAGDITAAQYRQRSAGLMETDKVDKLAAIVAAESAHLSTLTGDVGVAVEVHYTDHWLQTLHKRMRLAGGLTIVAVLFLVVIVVSMTSRIVDGEVKPFGDDASEFELALDHADAAGLHFRPASEDGGSWAEAGAAPVDGPHAHDPRDAHDSDHAALIQPHFVETEELLLADEAVDGPPQSDARDNHAPTREGSSAGTPDNQPPVSANARDSQPSTSADTSLHETSSAEELGDDSATAAEANDVTPAAARNKRKKGKRSKSKSTPVDPMTDV